MISSSIRRKAGQFSTLVGRSAVTPRSGTSHKPVLASRGQLGVTFIGHSSFFLQIGGKNVLIDPNFARWSLPLIGATCAATNLPHRKSEDPRHKRSLYFVPTFHARRLPHYHVVDRPIFLTWRLHGSLPANRSFLSATTSGPAFLTMDRLLDNACAGPLYLRRPEIVTMAVEAIRYRQIGRASLRRR